LQHNLALLRALPTFASQSQPVLVGASRKGFIGRLLDADPEDRLEGSIAAAVVAAWGGADIIRVHDVSETARALRVIDAIRFGIPEQRN
jgi:dihydropteroate synthase